MAKTLWLACLLYLGVEAIKVQVEQGELEGEQLNLVTGDGQYYSFKGIPYAAPPVGPLRFKAPQPPVNWQGTRNATQFGSVCIQWGILFGNATFGSEDCLFINVYTPEINPNTPLPVMVYIYGGGYKISSGNDNLYGPDFIVQNGVILVTFNYRLEALGLLSLDNEDVPGNAQLKDQVAALKWVQKNINKFGGDPDNVTLFGQSSGGASVILHVLSPLSQGLFKRAIAMSGVPSCDWSFTYQPRRRAFTLAHQLGNYTEDPKEVLEFLQTVPAEQLVNVAPNILTVEEIPAITGKMYHFTPVVEIDFGQEHFITQEPERQLLVGNVNTKELIIGHTSEEAIYDFFPLRDVFLSNYSEYTDQFVPRKLMYTKSPSEQIALADIIMNQYFGTKPVNEESIREFLNYMNDSVYYYDIYRYIQMLSKIMNSLYVYRFSAVGGRNVYGRLAIGDGISGAAHGDDVSYLFDPKRSNLNITKNSTDYEIVDNISKLWTNFAKFGNPTPDNDLVNWPTYNNGNQSFIDISQQLTVGQALDQDVADFWSSLYMRAGVDFDYFENLNSM